MKKYEILEHKADLKIRVFGRDIKELFQNAILGIFETTKTEGEGKEIKREIKISSFDLLSLLVDFLSEILYLSEVNKEVYQKIKFKKFSKKNIEGTLFGKKLKHKQLIIKGVTYYNLDIHQKNDKIWEATILFDI